MSPRNWHVIATLDVDSSPEVDWQVLRGSLTRCLHGARADETVALRRYFDPPGVSELRMTFDLTMQSGHRLFVVVGGYGFDVGLGGATRLLLHGSPLAVTGQPHLLANVRSQVRLERSHGRVRLCLDDTCVLDVVDPRPELRICDVGEFTLSQGILLHSARFESPQSASSAKAKTSTGYALHACIDFFDDLIHGPWTQQTIEQTMRFYRDRGVRRIYFVYHYGIDGGFWDHSPIDGHEKNIRQTAEAIGDFLPAMVRGAHEAGLELFAVLKPYETAFPYTYPHASSLAAAHGKVDRLEGRMWWLSHVVKEHPEWRLERQLDNVPPGLPQRRITRLVLTPEPGVGQAFDPARLHLWISYDNAGYVPYIGPKRVRRVSAQPGQIVVDQLEIDAPFLAMTVEGEATRTFGNTFRLLVQIQDDLQRAMPLSLATLTYPRNQSIENASFVFDYPISVVPGLIDDYCWLDDGKPLAIACGQERYLSGVLCEAYAGVQDWWMQQVNRCIAAGVDGIDFRIANHNRTFDWLAFGYSPPLIEAYRNRFGRDSLAQGFDVASLRRLRGELYTGFLRRARHRLRIAGKAMHLHVNPRMQSPSWHTEMEVHFDWQCWLREGLADEVTLKSGAARDSFAVAVLALVRELGLKVNYCPYLNHLPRVTYGPRIAEHHVHEARSAGVDGLTIYEHAALTAVQPDHTLKLTCDWLLDTLASGAATARAW